MSLRLSSSLEALGIEGFAEVQAGFDIRDVTEPRAQAIPRAWFEMFIKVLSPFAPHLAEEVWQRLGHTTTIAYEPWPAHDEAKLARDVMVIAVQVMGKLRGQIEVPQDATEATILAAAKADDKVQQFLAGKPIKREIYVKGRLVNLVV